MVRTFSLAVCLASLAGVAQAQYGQSAYAGPQTAMGGLGQVGVLNQARAQGRGGYRVAARTGATPPALSGAQTKPFAQVGSTPTISPYLNLFREETDNAIPNYHTFVRPQQDQYDANRQQQQQFQQLQRQVRQATYQTPATSVAGGARFGDTGRFYSGWRR